MTEIYKCRIPDWDGDEFERRIEATCAEEAAQELMDYEYWENCEDGETIDVEVMAPDGTITKWTVTAYLSWNYSVRERREG